MRMAFAVRPLSLLLLVTTIELTLAAPGCSTGATSAPVAKSLLIANVSGIPPCTVAPREPRDLDGRQQYRFLSVLEGPPSVTLVEPGPDEYGLLHAPVIWLDELPAGSSVDAGYPAAALQAVAAQLKSCARLTDDRESIYDIADTFQDGGSYAALLSDGFRRPWVVEAMGLIGYEGIALQVPVPVVGDDVRVLSDGRVAVLSPPSPLYADGAVYLFIDQHGQRLIDEFLAIAQS